MKDRKFSHPASHYVTCVGPEGGITLVWSRNDARILGSITPEVAAALGADLIRAAAYSVANSRLAVATTLDTLAEEDPQMDTQQLKDAVDRFTAMIED
jgi:hypothetical protein